MISKGKSGSSVRTENFQHLIQHIKQSDVMLYEALRKLNMTVTEIGDTFIETSPTAQQEKSTFGLVKTLTVATGLTLYYIVRKAGKFTDFTAKIKDQAPTGADAILDVMRSVDDGVTWSSIFPAGNASKIVLPAGKTATVITKKFAIATIAVGNLLRIDCLQIGSSNPGKGIEVVGRWS